MTLSFPKTFLVSIVTLATIIFLSLATACSSTPEAPTPNHAINFVRMVDEKAVCDSIRSGMLSFPDVAQCRTGNAVFHCEAGPNTPANCKKVADLAPPQQQPPQAERPPAPPSGSPVPSSPAPAATQGK